MKITSKKTINKKYIRYKKNSDIKEKIEKRYKILIGIVSAVLIILLLDLFYVQVIKNSYYVNKVEQLTKNEASRYLDRILSEYGR